MEILSRNEMRHIKAGQVELEPNCSCNCGTNEFACCKDGGCTCEPATHEGICDCTPDSCE